MRTFVRWASASPIRLILLTIVFAQLLAPVAAALLVVDSLRRGPAAATQSALLAILGVVAMTLVFPADLSVTLVLTLPMLVAGLLGGALLNWSRSLSLAFQGTMIGALIAASIAFAILPQADEIRAVVQDMFVTLLELGGVSDAQIAQAAALRAVEVVWVLLTSLLLIIVSTLMLGYWWYALLDDRVRFGADFRALKLGRVAGIALMVLLILSLFLDAPSLQSVAPIAVIGFFFQGLAVLHARNYRDKWPGAVIVVVYIFFIPWAPIALMGLSAVGLLDNFFELRGRGRPKE
jgi:hypothetical protein